MSTTVNNDFLFLTAGGFLTDLDSDGIIGIERFHNSGRENEGIYSRTDAKFR